MSRPHPISSALAVSAPLRPPPARETGIVAWLRTNLFNNIQNSVMTLLAAWALLVTLPGFVTWAITEAVWITDDSKVCRAAAGACWAVIAEKHRVMLFGTFPYDEHWRGVLVIAIVIGLSIFSGFKRFWSYWLFAAWLVAMAAILVL
jgi:general L-amino acid transport system permease protein